MSEIYGTDNSENLYLDSYSDMIYYYDDGLAYYGTEGNDSFYSGNGNDTLIGSMGDDSLDGGNGNDILYGGIGNDTLYGGIGNDILHDYEGNNNFYGGGGSDTFYIFDTSTFSGVTNTVLDFSPGEDKIALNLVSFDDLYISQSTGTSSADIYRASNSQLLAHIDMTTSHTLTSADFREYVEGDVW